MKHPQSTHAQAGSLAERSGLVMAAVGLVCAVGCGSSDGAGRLDGNSPTAPSNAASAQNAGSLSFSLAAQGNLKFDAFDYVITGPRFTRSASINVSNSSTVSALVEAIPVGSGYSITLMGTSLPPPIAECSGSASFSITAGAVSQVPIAVQCHEPSRATTPVPIPPIAPVALGAVLLLAGSASSSGKRRGSRKHA